MLNFFLSTLFTVFLASQASAAPEEIQSQNILSPDLPNGVIDPELLPIGYSGDEQFEYDIYWSGGIKIGELHLAITKIEDDTEGYVIAAHITTEGGLINRIYPVRDTHITHVRGQRRLPYRYEVWQKEGYNYEAHRLTEYDQKKGHITLRKNNKNEGEYHVIGAVNNEFSSFFNSRLMNHEVGEKFIVPTFADKRRVEVVVNTVSKKYLEDTSIGTVSTVEVMPIMTFKGLYDKKGDTVIWYTDDECRVPVLIKSKIVIGSLTARLAAYENSACSIYGPVGRVKK